MEKLLFKTDQLGEILVELEMRAQDGNLYKCVGIVTHEDKDIIKLSFSAKNSIVVDFIEVDKDQIIKYRIVPKAEINLI